MIEHKSYAIQLYKHRSMLINPRPYIGRLKNVRAFLVVISASSDGDLRIHPATNSVMTGMAHGSLR